MDQLTFSLKHNINSIFVIQLISLYCLFVDIQLFYCMMMMLFLVLLHNVLDVLHFSKRMIIF